MTKLIMTSAFGLSLTAATYAQDAVATPVTPTNVVLVTTIIGFLTLIATNVFALWRESRNRKWDQEDREIARMNARNESHAVAVKLATVVNQQHKELAAKLDENTEMTKAVGEKAVAAYDAANNFNNKLEDVKSQLPKG